MRGGVRRFFWLLVTSCLLLVTGSQNTFGASALSISGYAKTAPGVRIKGINMSASTGQAAVTDALGYYILTVPSPFSGTVTPSQTDWTFSPSSRTYSNAAADQNNQDFTGTYTVTYGGGYGSSSSPYQIYNAAQLNAIGANAGDWGKCFRLMGNIDLSGYDGQAGRPSFNRIGYYINFVGNAGFTGIFDGRGYTISNFTFNSDAGNDGVGIFGYVNSTSVTAIIKNLKLSNVNVSSTSTLGTGALIGMMDGGTVTKCSVQGGTVTGGESVGGLIGMIAGVFSGSTISDCNAALNVSGDMWVGGLFGYNLYDSLVLSNCSAACTVTGADGCGGLAGDNVGTMSKCSSSGTVTATGESAGGLAGDNDGIIQYCYSTANVTGITADEIGGLVGRNTNIISDSYATGTVSGYYPTGGLVGLHLKAPSTAGTIANCYSTGISNGAGFVGRNLDGTITSSFWNTQTSGQTWSDGGTGKSTSEMQNQATFVGWDFIIETANGSQSIWYMKPNNYPQLCWTAGIKYDGGTGEPNNPYLIYSGIQMNNIGSNTSDWSKRFKLMADISLAAYSGSLYNIIGIGSASSFTGTFDGNYHSISNFSYSSSTKNYVGIFGYVTGGTIKDLKVISPSLTDAGLDDMSYVGPIAGYANSANISGCAVIGGTVQGKNYVGGLVGLSSGSYIGSCFSSASVSGNSYIGGLVGGPSSTGALAGISDCYAHGNISGSSYVGGFVGNSSDTAIVNCYSTGTVSGTTNVGGFSGYNVNAYLAGVINVNGCFWDVTTSGRAASAAGTGLGTSAMQDINTYLGAYWDFAGELENGGSDSWAVPAGGGYPVLWYELSVAPSLPNFAGGSGTINDPYLIATKEQLNSIGHNARLMDKNFRLISDLDVNDINYYMIAERPFLFTGTFDGAGHSISHILVKPVFKLSSAGFIGTVQDSGAVKNLTIFDPNVYAEWGRSVGSVAGMNQGGTISNCHVVNARVWGFIGVGGLVGNNYLYAKISDCSATGHISENTFMSALSSAVGGLVGENSIYSEVKNSYAKCEVSGDDCVGGLVGSNLTVSTIKNCYAQGSVTGTLEYIGGLIGRNYGSTQTNYCYSSTLVTGPTGTDGVGAFIGRKSTSGTLYAACFWNTELNGVMPGIGNGTDANVISKTRDEMQTKSTFTSKEWDFVGEASNGENDIWRLCNDGHEYPHLNWQYAAGDEACPDGVDFIDYAILSAAWLSAEGDSNWYQRCDFSYDNRINWPDLLVFCQNWLEVISPDIAGDLVVYPAGVDFIDYAKFASAWMSINGESKWCSECDLVHDDSIDSQDLMILCDNWLEGK